MLKNRSRTSGVKKKALEKSILPDMNFLSLKEFYNSIPGDIISILIFITREKEDKLFLS
jgi:hypothetical protein